MVQFLGMCMMLDGFLIFNFGYKEVGAALMTIGALFTFVARVRLFRWIAVLSDSAYAVTFRRSR